MHVLLVGWWALGCGSEPREGPPSVEPDSPTGDTAIVTTEQWLPAFREALEADFEVREGRLGWIDLDDCCGWKSCWKRSPTTDYGVYLLPLGPDEAAAGRPVDADGLQFTWRLREDEAVVFVGQTPPESAYFSLRTYVHERHYSALGIREIAFANLGDSLNPVVLGTNAGPFGAGTAVITTADQNTEAAVRQAFSAAGIPASWVNTEVLPSDRVRFGLHDEADGLRMNLRLAAVADPAAREAYLANTGAIVWRLSPRSPRAHEPLPVPPPRPAGSGANESALEGGLAELRAAILAAHADRAVVETALNLREPPTDGSCWPGCNRDASYANNPPFIFDESDGAYVMVYGVNHVATGKAAYATAILYGLDNDDPGGVLDSTMMPGSARPFLGDHPDADLYYAWRFARDCGGDPFCSQVPAECPGVDIGEPTAVHYRTYLDPQTGTHPLASELIEGTVLVFGPPGSAQ